jgi:hypothetical protein
LNLDLSCDEKDPARFCHLAGSFFNLHGTALDQLRPAPAAMA